jgi:hypothetical protein
MWLCCFFLQSQDGTSFWKYSKYVKRHFKNGYKLLHYSYSSLQEVARICEELPALQMLDLSNSRIALPPVPAISNLTTLILNSCALKWKQLCHCSAKGVFGSSAGVRFFYAFSVKPLTSRYSVTALARVISDLSDISKHILLENELPKGWIGCQMGVAGSGGFDFRASRTFGNLWPCSQVIQLFFMA